MFGSQWRVISPTREQQTRRQSCSRSCGSSCRATTQRLWRAGTADATVALIRRTNAHDSLRMCCWRLAACTTGLGTRLPKLEASTRLQQPLKIQKCC